MAIDQNPYQAYNDGSIFSDNPLDLVIALYQGALDATRQAEAAVHARDILGRAKAVNKAFAIITELLVSLDHEKGGEISQNLKSLYSYMQTQILAAHARQDAQPLAEVAALLANLLEGWREAAKSPAAASRVAGTSLPHVRQSGASSPTPSATFYGGYLDDSAAACSSAGYSF